MDSEIINIIIKNGRGRFTIPLALFLIRNLKNVSYISAYPRSGSTWLRTIVCNVVYPEAESNPLIFNQIIPGVSFLNLGVVKRVPNPRVLFTHSKYIFRLPQTVYLVRDGRDAILSFFHFTTTRRNIKVPFEKWFDYYLKGYFGARWDENVTSWLKKGRNQMGASLLVEKFEDFKENPDEKMRKILDHLGIDANQQQITNAIEMASIERAKKWEREHLGEIQNPDASFYRGGKLGNWKEYFSSSAHSRFMEVAGVAMKLAGYSPIPRDS